MARSSILGGERAPRHVSGTDTDSLGPSDSSDSGSDVQGELNLEGHSDREERFGAAHTDRGSDSDMAGTGERGSAVPDEFVEEGADIAPDRIEVIGSDVEADEDDVSAQGVMDMEAEELDDESEDSEDET